jgi:hypothetical protein
VESLKEKGCTDLLEGISAEENVTHFSWSEMLNEKIGYFAGWKVLERYSWSTLRVEL